MRYAPWMLSASLIVACAGDVSRPLPSARSDAPPVPSSRPSAKAFLWVVVADSSGSCIPGASLRIVRGQLSGQTRVQDDTPCSVWDYGMGTFFPELEPGVEMTITASARGYGEQTETLYPNPFPQSGFFFYLPKK
jgi:hypothetical protein